MNTESLLYELLSLHVQFKPCTHKVGETTALSRLDYATARAAGFDMSQFSIAPARYLRS